MTLFILLLTIFQNGWSQTNESSLLSVDLSLTALADQNRKTYENYEHDEINRLERGKNKYRSATNRYERIMRQNLKKKRKFDFRRLRSYSGSSRKAKSSARRRRHRDQDEKDNTTSPSGSYNRILMVVGIILMVVIVAFILFRIFSKRNPDADTKVFVNIDEEQNPVEIPKTELEKALEQALNDGNYRAAIRIYFIFIIKDLSEKNWIKWKKDKTNMVYLYEMSNREEYNHFNSSVILYEVVWFGKESLTREEYNRVEPVFQKMLNKLGVR